VPTFAQSIRNAIFAIEDREFVKSDAPVPATMSGDTSVGFPSIVLPMGFGSQGLPMLIAFLRKPYEDRRVLEFAYAYEQASKLRKRSELVPPLPGDKIPYRSKWASRGREESKVTLLSCPI